MSEKRNSNLTNTSNVLQGLLENSKSPLSDQFTRWKLWARWKEVVGENIAGNSAPVSMLNGTLYIWVKNSSWHQQFIFMKDHFINTINERMGCEYVKNIFFTLDRKSVPGYQEDPEFEAKLNKL